MTDQLLSHFEVAFQSAPQVAMRLRESGVGVVRTLGVDAPRELLRAAGLCPVRLALTGGEAGSGPQALLDSRDGDSARTSLILRQIVAEGSSDRLLLSHAEAALPQVFATLRELARDAAAVPRDVHFIDLLHLPGVAARRYNASRLQELRTRLHAAGLPWADAARLHRAIRESNEQKSLLAQVAKVRRQDRPLLSGTQLLSIVGAAAILPMEEHTPLLRELLSGVAALPAQEGRRVFVSGSNHETLQWYRQVESCGVIIVGENHDWGDPWYGQRLAMTGDPLEALADPALHRTLASRSIAALRDSLATQIALTDAEFVIHALFPGDEAAPWEIAVTRAACAQLKLPLLCVNGEASAGGDELRERVSQFLVNRGATAIPAAVSKAPASSNAALTAARGGQRSQKSLSSLASFGAFQRTWFAALHERAARGEPFAAVNADAPQEILRAFDIPFVVNQWWASIVGAKQQSERYLGLLREHDYPTAVDAYSSQGLAATFDIVSKDAPWGGLPRPTILIAMTTSDGTGKLFEHWANECGADLTLLGRTIESRWAISARWWEDLPDRWDEALESQRLDYLTEELSALILKLEAKTGLRYSPEAMIRVMNLVNEQEELYRRTRDLIASARPAPVGIVDTMPATMVPQWHRGTEWGRDAARAFHDEVAARVARKEGVCKQERVRLMWIGRGLWSDMGFFQTWEESHGAVFVWSMYLALAADGYIRSFDRGRDPLRALAARFLTMGDELRMPTWAAAWHVREAQTHGVDGAIALADADPFVLSALQRAGVPLLRLQMDNFDNANVDRSKVERVVAAFIESLT